MGAPLHCNTCAGGGEFLENWGVAEPKRYFGVMVEAANSFRLHPTSRMIPCSKRLRVLWKWIPCMVGNGVKYCNSIVTYTKIGITLQF